MEAYTVMVLAFVCALVVCPFYALAGSAIVLTATYTAIAYAVFRALTHIVQEGEPHTY